MDRGRRGCAGRSSDGLPAAVVTGSPSATMASRSPSERVMGARASRTVRDLQHGGDFVEAQTRGSAAGRRPRGARYSRRRTPGRARRGPRSRPCAGCRAARACRARAARWRRDGDAIARRDSTCGPPIGRARHRTAPVRADPAGRPTPSTRPAARHPPRRDGPAGSGRRSAKSRSIRSRARASNASASPRAARRTSSSSIAPPCGRISTALPVMGPETRQVFIDPRRAFIAEGRQGHLDDLVCAMAGRAQLARRRCRRPISRACCRPVGG